jgi:hypothetical protein
MMGENMNVNDRPVEQNNALTQEDHRLLRYDHNTNQVERLLTIKKVVREEMPIIEFLEKRKMRIMKEMKEKNIESMTPGEIETAILQMQRF